MSLTGFANHTKLIIHNFNTTLLSLYWLWNIDHTVYETNELLRKYFSYCNNYCIPVNFIHN